jgi:drug/metabolite transporter (DMT)-like permease
MASLPMDRLWLGILAALAAATLYDLAVALQTLDARTVPAEHSLRPSLLQTLVRRPRWLGATLLGVLGWPLQVVALLLAPLTVVQPALSAGLLLLLALGAKALGESPGRREVLAVIGITVGVAGLAWAAPHHTTSHAGPGRLVPVLTVLALLAVVPYLSERLAGRGQGLAVVLGAGCAYAFSGVSSKLIADGLSAGQLLGPALWAVATGLAALLGLLSEMTALQHRPATQVAPLVFVVQVVVPVALAPLLLSESWSSTPLGGGAVVVSLGIVAAASAALGRSPAVAALLAQPPASEPTGPA